MGSFKGHVLPGTLFLGIGLWHIWSSIARHVANPKGFRVRVWNPVPGPVGWVKHLELYVIAVGAFVDMCIELLYSTHLKFFVDGVLNPSHMNDFEHSAMLFMFFVFGLVALLSETTGFVYFCLLILLWACAKKHWGKSLHFHEEKKIVLGEVLFKMVVHDRTVLNGLEILRSAQIECNNKPNRTELL